ncbi:hypothetical protein V6N13_001783 [Hibiscus sabdariffa]
MFSALSNPSSPIIQFWPPPLSNLSSTTLYLQLSSFSDQYWPTSFGRSWHAQPIPSDSPLSHEETPTRSVLVSVVVVSSIILKVLVHLSNLFLPSCSFGLVSISHMSPYFFIHSFSLLVVSSLVNCCHPCITLTCSSTTKWGLRALVAKGFTLWFWVVELDKACNPLVELVVLSPTVWP